MMRGGRRSVLALTVTRVLFIFSFASTALAQRAAVPIRPSTDSASADRIELRRGWEIQSSCSVPEKGDVISSPQFHPQNWIPTSVPSTPVAAELAAKMIPDPYVGMNLREIPGGDYPIDKIFANLPMPETSPYHCSWWYRTEFRLPASFRGRHTALHFDGINYRANIWLNGKQIANSNDITGMWRLFELDATNTLVSGINTLAVEVFAPTEYDLGLTWVDWNPAPPDKDMGLWRPVYLTASGAVTVRNPAVISNVEPSLATAHLTISAEVRNLTDQPIAGDLRAVADGFHVIQLVALGPNETKTVTFTPEKFRELNIQHPRLWWPARMGRPALERLTLSFAIHGAVSDRNVSHFGIREVTSELQDGYRLFRINGKPVQIRRLRQHPSVFVWLNGSDNPPPPDVEQRYIDVLNQYAWANPFVSSAADKATPVTGTSGVKMTGPYDYVPPSYWLLDDRRGGAFGFNTETSPGPAIPPAACLRKFIPEDHLWPIDDVWRYHSGGGQFKDVALFNAALNA